jgi:hypothetical protein
VPVAIMTWHRKPFDRQETMYCCGVPPFGWSLLRCPGIWLLCVRAPKVLAGLCCGVPPLGWSLLWCFAF